MSSSVQELVRNRLVRALSVEAFERLQPHMEQVDLPRDYVLVETDLPTRHVYFLENGLGSVVAVTADDEKVEIGHLGSEGMSGSHVLLMSDRTPVRTFMQVAGSAIRVPVRGLMAVVNDDLETRELLLRYVHCCALQLAHCALVNARYTIHQRLARWLLMCHDRLRNNDLPLTHELLALMLGVRRSGVTTELHVIEGLGAILATRGNVHIRDRAKLEEIAGGCYGQPEREYQRLIGGYRFRIESSIPAQLETAETASV